MSNSAAIIRKLTEDDGDNVYLTTVKDIDVQGIDSAAFAENASAEVKWELQLDARSWGIKSIDANILEVRATWTRVSPDPSNPDEDASVPEEISSKEGQWNLEFETGNNRGSFYPTHVDVYLKERRIVVHF